jgi:hypothetical protein
MAVHLEESDLIDGVFPDDRKRQVKFFYSIKSTF